MVVVDLPKTMLHNVDMNELYTIDDKGCWLWQKAFYKSGYGVYCGSYAHRIFYEVHNGVRINKENHVHHRCHNKKCVNPKHLVEVDRHDHAKIHRQIERSWCKNGHEMTEANTYIVKVKGHWQCRACSREKMARYRQRDVTGPLRKKVLSVRADVAAGCDLDDIANKWGVTRRTVRRYVSGETFGRF